VKPDELKLLQPQAPRLLSVVPARRARAAAGPGSALGSVLPGTDISAAACYLSTLRPSGRRSMLSRLTAAAALLRPGETAGTFPWGSLRFEHVVYLRTRLTLAGASPASVNLTLVALRQTARAARQLGQMDASDAQAIREVPGVRAVSLPKGRMLTPAERDALFRACARDASARGARDACAIALMLGAGLRREECAALDLAGVNLAASRVALVGKGGREASQPLNAAAVGALRDWIAQRGGRAGALLLPVSWAGRVRAGRLSGKDVYRIVAARSAEAGLRAATPHDLRRTYISSLLETEDASLAQQLARHGSVHTTLIYDRREERARVGAACRVYVGYRPLKVRVKRTPRKARKSRRRRFRKS
jgi:site-specific recombinase XerC